MPLFAYICNSCSAQNELLVRYDENVSCPQCGSKKMERQMSRFAALTGQKEALACSGCAMAGEGCPTRQGAGCMP